VSGEAHLNLNLQTSRKANKIDKIRENTRRGAPFVNGAENCFRKCGRLWKSADRENDVFRVPEIYDFRAFPELPETFFREGIPRSEAYLRHHLQWYGGNRIANCGNKE